MNIGDIFNLDESIKLDCRYSERKRVRRLLEDAGVIVRQCQYYNKGFFAKGLIVHVARNQGAEAEAVLSNNGYEVRQ